MNDGRREKLAEFVAWVGDHITGDEKGQAQLFLDRLFQAFGQKGSLEVGGTPEMRIKKPTEDGGGTGFADYVWKPVVLIEMKKRGVGRPRLGSGRGTFLFAKMSRSSMNTRKKTSKSRFAQLLQPLLDAIASLGGSARPAEAKESILKST